MKPIDQNFSDPGRVSLGTSYNQAASALRVTSRYTSTPTPYCITGIYSDTCNTIAKYFPEYGSSLTDLGLDWTYLPVVQR